MTTVWDDQLIRAIVFYRHLQFKWLALFYPFGVINFGRKLIIGIGLHAHKPDVTGTENQQKHLHYDEYPAFHSTLILVATLCKASPENSSVEIS